MLSGDVSTKKLGYSSDFDQLIVETFTQIWEYSRGTVIWYWKDCMLM